MKRKYHQYLDNSKGVAFIVGLSLAVAALFAIALYGFIYWW